MLYLSVIVVIIVLSIVTSSFFHRFTLIRIKGNSMSPTFKNGQFKLVDRKISPTYISLFGEKVKEGTIFVYQSPNDHMVVKRLKQKVHITSVETFYWFEGDNPEDSYDSRNYGFIKEDRIFGEVIDFKDFLSRTFFHKRKRLEGE